MAKTADVIVVGAGVVGCSVAYHLAQKGVKRVLVLDRGTVGGEASAAAAGMLAPQCEAAGPGPFLDFCLAARQYYEGLAPELKDLTRIDIEYLKWGILYLLDEEGDEAAEGRYRWQKELGLVVERLTADEVGKLEPGLTKEIAGALFFPGDHHVNNTELTRALAQAARTLGVQIVEGTPVTGFVYEEDRVAGVRTPQEIYTAAHIVLCTGAWSGQLGVPLGRRIPVEPARGQMLCAELAEPPLRHPVWGKGGYLVPRLNGGLIVGSTVEYVGFEKTVTLDGIRHLSELTSERAATVPKATILATTAFPTFPFAVSRMGRRKAVNLPEGRLKTSEESAMSVPVSFRSPQYLSHASWVRARRRSIRPALG